MSVNMKRKTLHVIPGIPDVAYCEWCEDFVLYDFMDYKIATLETAEDKAIIESMKTRIVNVQCRNCQGDIQLGYDHSITDQFFSSADSGKIKTKKRRMSMKVD